jgi:ABC-type lipoprotein export system ATPase subunit
MSDPAISVEDVVKTYDDGRIRALDGISFSVESGSFVAVVGPSGSGKSTLLHLLAGLDRPDGGSILLQGRDLAEEVDRDRYRGEFIGLVFQLDNLLPMLTAAENIEIPMVGLGASSRMRRERVGELLSELGLEHVSGQRPSALSGGERQRVAIARALANRPAFLLLDEPTGRLDTASGRNVLRLVHSLRESQGATVLLVTHDNAVARSADRHMTIVDGRIAPARSIGECPSCGHAAESEGRFCSECGSPMATSV